jgi:adenosylhomocysteine nucleosidase
MRDTTVPSPQRPLILAAMHPEAKAIRRALGPGDAEVRVIGIGATSLPPVAEVRAASAIILAGFAGALDPSLKVGEVILDTRIPLPGLPFRQAPFHTAKALVATPAEKAKLFAETGAAAVDMETEPVRLLAERAGVPFIGLRAISDTAEESLDASILRFIDQTGQVAPLRLASTLLRQPSLVAALVRLGKTSKTAGASLGDALRALLPALRAVGDPATAVHSAPARP